MERQLEGMLKVSMENIRHLVDVDTIVGNPIQQIDGSMIIPISHVKMGFATGGSDFKANNKLDNPFGGALGGSVTISPMAFLVVNGSDVKVLHMKSDTHLYEKIIDKIPDFFEGPRE